MAAMKNDINIPLLGTIGIVGALLLVTSAVAVDGWYKSFELEVVDQKWEQSPNYWLDDIRAQQKANLEDAHKIPNARPSRYHVTIEDAMQVVIKNQGKLSS